jgi:hypothetical protein
MLETSETVSPSSAAMEMTVEQKFLFDLKGWLLLPGVLDTATLKAVREHCWKLKNAPATLAPHERHPLGGPGQELVDHPSIVGILREIIAPDVSEEAYGFRCESSFIQYRPFGAAGTEGPHCGPSTGLFGYRVDGDRIWSGLTRVVWELKEVRKGMGGTPVMSGSHKAKFPVPASYRSRDIDPALFEYYSCPAGSVLIFSENCWHYGATWKDVQYRLAIFNCYNSYLSQVHRMNIPPEVIEAMPAKRRTAFRGVWKRNLRGGPEWNDYFSRDNQAL